MEGATLCPDP